MALVPPILRVKYDLALWPSCHLEIWEGGVFAAQGDVLITGRRSGLKVAPDFWDNAQIEPAKTIFDADTVKISGISSWPQIYCLYRRPHSENFLHYYKFRESMSGLLTLAGGDEGLTEKTVALLPLSWHEPEISARLGVETITSWTLHRLELFPPTNLCFQLWNRESTHEWQKAVENVTWEVAAYAKPSSASLPIWQRID